VSYEVMTSVLGLVLDEVPLSDEMAIRPLAGCSIECEGEKVGVSIENPNHQPT
jgi:hypothetical protein